jgi:hypothetical protein
MEKKEILEWKEPHQKKIGNTVASSFKMILWLNIIEKSTIWME